jgi:hypothetical protein
MTRLGRSAYVALGGVAFVALSASEALATDRLGGKIRFGNLITRARLRNRRPRPGQAAPSA